MLEVLLKIRAQIDRGWCQNGDAHSADGRKISIYSVEVSRCSLGGACHLHHNGELVWTLFKEKLGLKYKDWLYEWNDDPRRTKGDILELIDSCIRSLGTQS